MTSQEEKSQKMDYITAERETTAFNSFYLNDHKLRCLPPEKYNSKTWHTAQYLLLKMVTHEGLILKDLKS